MSDSKEIIEFVLREKNISQAELSRLLGKKNNSTVNMWLSKNGKYISGKDLQALSGVTGFTVDELMSATKMAKSGTQLSTPKDLPGKSLPFVKLSSKVPIVIWEKVQMTTTIEEFKNLEKIADFEFTSTDPSSFAVSAQNNSMFPHVVAGDLIIVNPTDELRMDGLVLANLKKDGLIIRNYSMSKKWIKLSSANSTPPPLTFTETDFHWICRISWVCKPQI